MLAGRASPRSSESPQFGVISGFDFKLTNLDKYLKPTLKHIIAIIPTLTNLEQCQPLYSELTILSEQPLNCATTDPASGVKFKLCA